MERAGLLGGVKYHLVEPDAQNKLRGEALAEQIRIDKENGLIPFYVSRFVVELNQTFFSLVEEKVSTR